MNEARESNVQKAVSLIDELDVLTGKSMIIRVENR
jgi:hypothetical protein